MGLCRNNWVLERKALAPLVIFMNLDLEVKTDLKVISFLHHGFKSKILCNY